MQIYSNYGVDIQMCLATDAQPFAMNQSGRCEVINSHDDYSRTRLSRAIEKDDIAKMLISHYCRFVCSHKVNGRISWRIDGTYVEYVGTGGMQC